MTCLCARALERARHVMSCYVRALERACHVMCDVTFASRVVAIYASVLRTCVYLGCGNQVGKRASDMSALLSHVSTDSLYVAVEFSTPSNPTADPLWCRPFTAPLAVYLVQGNSFVDVGTPSAGTPLKHAYKLVYDQNGDPLMCKAPLACLVSHSERVHLFWEISRDVKQVVPDLGRVKKLVVEQYAGSGTVAGASTSAGSSSWVPGSLTLSENQRSCVNPFSGIYAVCEGETVIHSRVVTEKSEVYEELWSFWDLCKNHRMEGVFLRVPQPSCLSMEEFFDVCVRVRDMGLPTVL